MNVTIIGGSVAGLNTALYLLSSNSEHNITLLEKKKAIGDNIICAGGIASYMIKKLKLDIPKEFIATKVQRVRFYSPSLKYAELNLKKEYGYVLWRDKWERWLGEKAQELGAKIYLKSHAPNKIMQNSDVIVGADGLLGISRRLAGKTLPSREDIHVAIQAVGYTKNCEEDAISLFFGSKFAPKGYAWTFPLGNSEFRIGLGIPLSLTNKLVSSFQRFTTSIKAKIIEKPKAKLLPTAHPDKILVNKNIALVGDAALATDPAIGGGIAPAVITGKMVAEAISKENLTLYNKLWRTGFYKRNKRRYKLKQVLVELTDRDFETLVDLLKNFKPISESIGVALTHLIIELALKHPRFLTRHKVLRRLLT